MPKLESSAFSAMRNQLKKSPADKETTFNGNSEAALTNTVAGIPEPHCIPEPIIIDTEPKKPAATTHNFKPEKEQNVSVSLETESFEESTNQESNTETEQAPAKPAAAQKKSRGPRAQKNADSDKKSRGKGVLFYLPEDVHWGLKAYCLGERKTIDGYFQALHNDARFHTFACSEPGCKCQFIKRVGPNEDCSKPQMCPDCGSTRIRQVKTY